MQSLVRQARDKFCVQLLRPESIPAVLSIYNDSAMGEGTRSVLPWLKLDPQGIRVAINQNDEIAGMIGCIRHQNIIHFGFYAVRREFRRSGAGILLSQTAKDYAGFQNSFCNSVPERVKLYVDELDLPIVDDQCSTHVYGGHHTNTSALNDNLPPGVNIKPLNNDLMQHVCGYDFSIAGYDRSMVLKSSFQEEESQTFVAVSDDQRCCGFGTIKPSLNNSGHVGPLYADNPQIAEALMKKLVESMPQRSGLSMATFSGNQFANDLVKRMGCQSIQKYVRLCTKGKMDLDIEKVYIQFDTRFSPL